MDIFLIGAGAITLIIGWIWIMITAFSESVPWAVVMFFFSPVAALYGFLKWDELKVPTILYITGFIVLVIGKVI